MAIDVEQDLDLFFADFGRPVTFAGAPDDAQGILYENGAAVLEEDGRARVGVTERAVLLKTSVADLFARSAALTVSGVPYTARERLQVAAGAFTLVYLRDRAA